MGLLRALTGRGRGYKPRHGVMGRGRHGGRVATPAMKVVAPWSQRGGYSGVGIPGGLGSLLSGPRVSAPRRKVSKSDTAFSLFRW
jgi:hypothetical protein